MQERIVITGMGAVSPLGLSSEESWQNAINGISGVGPITLFDPSDFLVKFACEVKGFEPEKYMHAKEARRRDRVEQLATAAAQEALRQSGLEVEEAHAGRVGVIVSSAIGGLASLQEGVRVTIEENPRRVSPFLIPMLMSNGPAGLIAIDYGFKGPSFSVASACASGADGIGMAWMLLRAGVVDAVVSGAAEATITRLGVAAFDRLGAMSRRNEDYSMTPQPFDLNRDGLVMGEGAAGLILERESHARQRGRRSWLNWQAMRLQPMPSISRLRRKMARAARLLCVWRCRQQRLTHKMWIISTHTAQPLRSTMPPKLDRSRRLLAIWRIIYLFHPPSR